MVYSVEESLKPNLPGAGLSKEGVLNFIYLGLCRAADGYPYEKHREEAGRRRG